MATKQVTTPRCCRLNYYDSTAGTTDRAPLVLLSANPGDMRDYDGVRSALEEHFRVISLDWPGYGGSSYEGQDFSSGEVYFYNVLLELLEHLKLPPAFFLGNSVGGNVACRLAAEHPHQVIKLVLVAPGGFTPPGIIPTYFCKFMATRFAPSPHTFAKFYLGHQQSEFVKAMLARAKSSQNTATARAMIKAVWRSFNAPTHDLYDTVKRGHVKAPAMLIFGARDPIIGSGDAKRAGDAFGQGARLVKLNTGHAPFAELPQEFLDVVLPFLREPSNVAGTGDD